MLYSVKYSGIEFGIQMVEKRLDAKWCGFRMPFEYRTAQPFETGQMDAILVVWVWVFLIQGYGHLKLYIYRQSPIFSLVTKNTF